MILDKDEKIEDLQCNNLKIIQNKNLYTFTSDSVILANFIQLRNKDNCVEIGGGSGIISILLSAKTNFNQIKMFEIQKEMADLARKNVELNSLSDKIEVICDDVKNFRNHIENESIDVVFSNPPYMPQMTENENQARQIARHDGTLSVEDLCKTASKMLKINGKFYVVYSSKRSAELIYNLMQNNLEPKRMFFTENGKGKTVLVIIEAVKGGKHQVEVLPNLVTNDLDGKYLEILHSKYIK